MENTNNKLISKLKNFDKNKSNIKVFLGGTCNESKILIDQLSVDYFNPVVSDWTPECQQEEIIQRKICDFCLYTITPKMIGYYSIAEVIDDSNKKPKETIFCLLKDDIDDNGNIISFSDSQMKSLNAVGQMVFRNGGMFFTDLKDVANFLNKPKEYKMKKRSESEELKIPVRKCEDCIYYGVIDSTDGIVDSAYGYCRRFPPKIYRVKLFRRTYSTKYPTVAWCEHACGEFSRGR